MGPSHPILPSGTMRGAIKKSKTSTETSTISLQRPSSLRNCDGEAQNPHLIVARDLLREFVILILRLAKSNLILRREYRIIMDQRQIRVGMIWWSQGGKSSINQALMLRRSTRANLTPELSVIVAIIRIDWHDWGRLKFLAKISMIKIKIKVFPLLVQLWIISSKDSLVPKQKKDPNPLIRHRTRAIAMSKINIKIIIIMRVMIQRMIKIVITANINVKVNMQ